MLIWSVEELQDFIVGLSFSLPLSIFLYLTFDAGAEVIVTSRTPATIAGAKSVISGIEVTDNKCGEKLAQELNGQMIDILINNAGYFYEPVEKIDSLNFEEEMKMIDICAVGPLRISSGLVNAGLMAAGSKVLIRLITLVLLRIVEIG